MWGERVGGCAFPPLPALAATCRGDAMSPGILPILDGLFLLKNSFFGGGALKQPITWEMIQAICAI